MVAAGHAAPRLGRHGRLRPAPRPVRLRRLLPAGEDRFQFGEALGLRIRLRLRPVACRLGFQRRDTLLERGLLLFEGGDLAPQPCAAPLAAQHGGLHVETLLRHLAETTTDPWITRYRRAILFYAGVPCSFLTPLIKGALSSPGLAYVGAASEGEAVDSDVEERGCLGRRRSR